MSTVEDPEELEVKEELRKTREALGKLTTSRKRQRVYNCLFVLLFACVIGVGWWGFHNANEQREALKREACAQAQDSTMKSRRANNLFADSIIKIGVDKNNPRQVARADAFLKDLQKRQDRILKVPSCEGD